MAVTPTAASRGAIGAAAAAIFVASCAIYAPIRRHAWLNYDDDIYITSNADLLQGLSWDGIAWAFTTLHGANWFPMTWLSWMLDFEIYGLDAGGFHATSLLLHAAAATLLFLAFVRLTGDLWRPAFVAGVFAFHPLHVESVAWAAARKDVLSGLFFAWALFVYAGAARRAPSTRRIAAVTMLLAFGLLAKPMLVTFPFVLLLLDGWPRGRFESPDGAGFDASQLRSAGVEKWPLFAVVAAVCAVTLFAQGQGGTVSGLDRLPLTARLGNAGVAYVAYLGKAFWPGGLAVFYPHAGDSLPLWKSAGAGILVLALTAGAIAAARRRPHLAVGWLWFVGMLVPTIGLVQVGSQSMADRYSYLPLVGLALAAAWEVPAWLGAERSAARARAALAVGCLAIAALAALTTAQIRHWRDSVALFEHAVRVTEDNHIAHAQLGAALVDARRTTDGVAHLREAIRIRPSFLEVANNLAWLLATDPDPEIRNSFVALRLAERAVILSDRRDPKVLDTLASAYASAGRFDEAVREAERAVELAREDDRTDLVDSLSARLLLYRSERPYFREPGTAIGESRRVDAPEPGA